MIVNLQNTDDLTIQLIAEINAEINCDCYRMKTIELTKSAEQDVLRSLKQEEVIEVTQMARRIAAILLLEPELDANYEAVKQATYPWSAQKQ